MSTCILDVLATSCPVFKAACTPDKVHDLMGESPIMEEVASPLYSGLALLEVTKVTKRRQQNTRAKTKW